MKKVSLFALLVLAGMLFIAPSLKAQEAAPEAEVAPAAEVALAAEATPAQEAEAEAAKKEKAKFLANLEDDEQIGNFLAGLDAEERAEYISAVNEYGDEDLKNRVNAIVEKLGIGLSITFDEDLLIRGEATKAVEMSRGSDYGF